MISLTMGKKPVAPLLGGLLKQQILPLDRLPVVCPELDLHRGVPSTASLSGYLKAAAGH